MMDRKSAIHGESGYRRIALDAYQTPEWCTCALLDQVAFSGIIWECAAGDGSMADALWKAHPVTASDVRPTSRQVAQHDFFAPLRPETVFRNIVTNPPYSSALPFIERALSLVEPRGGKVAMLLRNEYDSAARRKHLFQGCVWFDTKLVLTKRPKWFADERASPRHNFSWFVWDTSRNNGSPRLCYS